MTIITLLIEGTASQWDAFHYLLIEEERLGYTLMAFSRDKQDQVKAFYDMPEEQANDVILLAIKHYCKASKQGERSSSLE